MNCTAKGCSCGREIVIRTINGRKVPIHLREGSGRNRARLSPGPLRPGNRTQRGFRLELPGRGSHRRDRGTVQSHLKGVL
jgi:hypothetical protein